MARRPAVETRRQRLSLSQEIATTFEAALAKMAHVGAIIADPADVPSAVDGSLWKCIEGSRSVIVNADFKEYLGRYLQELGGDGGCRSVEDVIA